MAKKPLTLKHDEPKPATFFFKEDTGEVSTVLCKSIGDLIKNINELSKRNHRKSLWRQHLELCRDSRMFLEDITATDYPVNLNLPNKKGK